MWRTAGRAAGCHFTRINVNTEKYSSVVNWREQIRSLVMKLTPVVERSVTSFRSWHVIIPRFFVLLCIFSLAISLSLSLSRARFRFSLFVINFSNYYQTAIHVHPYGRVIFQKEYQWYRTLLIFVTRVCCTIEMTFTKAFWQPVVRTMYRNSFVIKVLKELAWRLGF